MKFPSGSAWSAGAGAKRALAACALFIAASLGGCAIIEAEKHNRGGFLDHIADERWMQADSKKMRALRAVALEASLARIAMIAPKNAQDRALLARRIGETSKRAYLVHQCAFSSQPLIAGQRSDEPCFFFDSIIVDYENALFDLALVALPLEEARKLINRVTGGIASIAINPLELVQTLINIGREAFRYGRVVGAIYRDTLELEVQVWLASPEFASGQLARGVPPEFVVTTDKVARLAAVYDRGNDNIPAWRAEIAALRAQGLEPVPDQRFITQIFTIIAYFCRQIVTETDPAFEECRQSKLIQSLPVATGLGRGLSGFGTGTSTRTVDRGRKSTAGQSAPDRRSPRSTDAPASQRPTQTAALPPDPAYVQYFDRYDPTVHTKPFFEDLQRALCVPSAEQGQVTRTTTALIQIYEISDPTAASKPVDGKLNDAELAEVIRLGDCPSDRWRNYFERRTFPNGADISWLAALLNKVLDGGTLTTNATLAQARGKIAAVRKSAIIGPKLRLPLPELTDHVTPDLIVELRKLP